METLRDYLLLAQTQNFAEWITTHEILHQKWGHDSGTLMAADPATITQNTAPVVPEGLIKEVRQSTDW